jgi:hypothetical protein
MSANDPAVQAPRMVSEGPDALAPAQSSDRTDMTIAERSRLELLDRLLNDPAVPFQPSKVWSLAAEIAEDP